MSSNEGEVVDIMPNIFIIDYHNPQCIFFLQIPTGDLKQILLQQSLQKKMEVIKLLEENTYTHKSQLTNQSNKKPPHF